MARPVGWFREHLARIERAAARKRSGARLAGGAASD
jgi:hypothetical protein